MAYKQAQSRTAKAALPTELPDPASEQANNVPDGAVWEITEKGTAEFPVGSKFRLQHSKQVPAQWVPVLKREKKDKPAEDSKPAAKK